MSRTAKWLPTAPAPKMQIRMRWSFLFVVRRRNVPVSTGLPRGATPDPRHPAASSVINKREKSVRRQVAYGKMLNLALMSSLEVFLPTARLRMKFERTEAGTRSPRILSQAALKGGLAV
ncbi:MAG: hypothetical protein ACXU89_15915 [Xanthobacteraceae bacterium]